MNGKMNLKKMEDQEKKDFKITKKILENIFEKHNYNVHILKTDNYNNVDAIMWVQNKQIETKIKNYKVEIKNRNVTEKKYTSTMPLKVKKYCNIMEISEGETPLVVYLLNDEDFYIFDLNKLDMNKVIIKNWNIPKVQFTDHQELEKTPTMFIPIDQAVYKGKIN